MAIPEQASAIHGIGTDHARKHGARAAPAVEEIAHAVAEVLRSGVPLVVMNARYDLSLLDRECHRYGLPSVDERVGGAPSPVIDPLVIDKHVDKYRKGKRALQALCDHYGVTLDGAHEASADAVAAVRVVRRMESGTGPSAPCRPPNCTPFRSGRPPSSRRPSRPICAVRTRRPWSRRHGR